MQKEGTWASASAVRLFLQPAVLANHAPGATAQLWLVDFLWTKSFFDHKMATSQERKSMLLSHGGTMKSVKQVNNHKASYKRQKKHLFYTTEPSLPCVKAAELVKLCSHETIFISITYYIPMQQSSSFMLALFLRFLIFPILFYLILSFI